jgi:hypothetical protein
MRRAGLLETARGFRAQAVDYTAGLKRCADAFAELDAHATSARTAGAHHAAQAAADALLDAHRRELPALSQHRAAAVDAASASVHAHADRRRSAERAIAAEGKAAVREADELKDLAVDASAYIKHFKAMLLS